MFICESVHHIKQSSIFRIFGLKRSIHMDLFYDLLINFLKHQSGSCVAVNGDFLGVN